MWVSASRAAGRDEAVFAAALTAALPRLRRRALALTGQLARADDLVQDCLERAWRPRDSLNSPEVSFAWLATILRHAHIDWLRRNKHETGSVNLDDIAESLGTIQAGEHSATLDLIEALQTLNADHRRILLLAGVEGLSYQEIGQELRIPVGTVMSRLARARQALRARLDGALPNGNARERLSR